MRVLTRTLEDRGKICRFRFSCSADEFPPKSLFGVQGYQPPIIVRRARGHAAGGVSAKGGDVAIFVTAGLHLAALTNPLVARTDDCTEVCGCDLSWRPLIIVNIYRPPIRNTDDDHRTDNFDSSALPSGQHYAAF